MAKLLSILANWQTSIKNAKAAEFDKKSLTEKKIAIYTKEAPSYFDDNERNFALLLDSAKQEGIQINFFFNF